MAGKLKNAMETSAVYWEPKIKTYGFQGITNLSLFEVTIEAEQIPLFESLLHDPEQAEIRFHLVLLQARRDLLTRITILFDRKWEDSVLQYCDSAISLEKGESFSIRSPVELIFFFGPHFGERYGIADKTFQVLADNHIRILAAGFSGSAVYLVLPENGIKKAGPVFNSAFEVPKSK